MKRKIKLCFILIAVLSFSAFFALHSFATTFEEQYEEQFEAYQKAFEDDSELNEILGKSEKKRTRSSYPVPYPMMSFEEFVVMSQRDQDEVQRKSARAAASPTLNFFDSMGSIPFASAARGASCDKRVCFYDTYRHKYFVIEYNSYYGELLLCPDYTQDDGYFFWVWFRAYTTSSSNANALMNQNSVVSSYFGTAAQIPYLGFNDDGEPVYVFYIYSFSEPVEYNSASEVSVGDKYPTDLSTNSRVVGQDTTVTNHTKVGQYYAECRYRSFGYYVDNTMSSLNDVVVNHARVPVVAGLFCYSDESLRIVNNSGVVQNQSVDHFGNISGNITVNDYNIYQNYQAFTMSSYEYWLFGNFINRYENQTLNGYGIFQGIYDTVFLRLDYFSQVILPNGVADMQEFLGEYISTINSVLGVWLYDNNGATSSAIWILNMLLGLAIVFLVIRSVVYITRW